MQNAVQIVLLTSEQFNDLMAEVRAIREDVTALKKIARPAQSENAWMTRRAMCTMRNNITPQTLEVHVRKGLVEKIGSGKSALYRLATIGETQDCAFPLDKFAP